MKIRDLVGETLKALSIEDERHLAFIFGYRLHANKFRRTKKRIFEGVFFRALIFFKYVYSRISFRSRKYSPVTHLFYAETNNQCRAMLSTVQSIENTNQLYSFIFDSSVNCTESKIIRNSKTVSFNFREVISSTLLLLIRSRTALQSLNSSGNSIAARKYFDKFAQAYIYLPYFHNLLRGCEPRYVIMSNDHNTPNRCLKLAAQQLGIPTVFMQHGSGNATLPPMDFDYAFLDGMESVEKYSQCAAAASEEQRPVHCDRTSVFLSGSKSNIVVRTKEHEGFAVGIAINPHDQLHEVLALLNTLLCLNVTCITRAHPAQPSSDILALEELSEVNDSMKVSIFADESTGEFLSRSSFLIAGNSSIHLEAIRARVPTYYCQFGDNGLPYDYLHHVKGGIAKQLPDNFYALGIEDIHAMAVLTEESENAVRRFSESFGTDWEGREGELLVETLNRIDSSSLESSSIYKRLDDNRGYKAVYALTAD